MTAVQVIHRLLGLFSSESGIALLDTVLDVVEDLRARGHSDDEIRARVADIRDAVRASDARDAAMLDRYFPPPAAPPAAGPPPLPPNPYG